MPPIVKALSGFEIKSESEGRVKAVFSTFNVIDKDGDVTLPGAFKEGQQVRISAYGHGSWKGLLPVGKGTIHANKKEAWLDGEFFLNTTHGRDTFETVKQLGKLGEWSYGFDLEDSSEGQKDGQDVRFLAGVDVHEVSPVLLGAGVNTRTVSAKSGDGKQLQSEVSMRLRDAGRERWGGEDTYVWNDDYDLDEGWAVFSVEKTDEGPARFVQVPFTRGDDGAVTLGDEETDVFRTTDYAPKSVPPPAAKGPAHDETFAAFPHHDDEGVVDLRACASAVAVLNGAGHGSDLTAEDRKAAYEHFAEHMRDGDREPPELRDELLRQMKLSDHLHAVVAEVDVARGRVAEVLATRMQEKGKGLGAASLAAVDELESALKDLREVMASAAHTEPSAARADLAEIEAAMERHAMRAQEAI